jgi:peptide deformylase
LRKVENVSAEFPDLKETIVNMYETMYNANGVGTSLPVGKAIRIFVIDTSLFSDDDLDLGEQKN